MRLIDADALLGKAEDVYVEYENGYSTHADVVRVRDIDNAPTIDPERRGKWEKVEDADYTVKCSACGFFDYDYLTGYAFCPVCGARMDGEGERMADRSLHERALISAQDKVKNAREELARSNGEEKTLEKKRRTLEIALYILGILKRENGGQA